jgi:hypothetical protein
MIPIRGGGDNGLAMHRRTCHREMLTRKRKEDTTWQFPA